MWSRHYDLELQRRCDARYPRYDARRYLSPGKSRNNPSALVRSVMAVLLTPAPAEPMADQTVREIRTGIGDRLVGDDGLDRVVVDTMSGNADMYRVQAKGDTEDAKPV